MSSEEVVESSIPQSKTQLIKRHQKEIKDFKNQSNLRLKKAGKDKAAKKKVQEEIQKQEEDLKVKHANELEEWNRLYGNNEEVENIEPVTLIEDKQPSEKKGKSRTQKRREAKKQEALEREKRIEEAKNNTVNLGLIEFKAIEEQIKPLGLKIQSVPANGNCLYKALAIQLEAIKGEKYTAEKLREIAADYMLNNKDDFIPFLDLPEEKYEEFCEDTRNNPSSWGGQLEIRAICNSLKIPVNIYSNEGQSPIKMGDEFDTEALNLSFHRSLYSLGNHYNAVVKISED